MFSYGFMNKRISIQGVKGCFHEQAARLFYQSRGHDVPDIVECLTFDDLYVSIDKGESDAAIMAIENTVSGGLLPNFELLRKYDRKIKGEVFLRIQQNLMALPGQKIEDIKEVRTHYMAITARHSTAGKEGARARPAARRTRWTETPFSAISRPAYHRWSSSPHPSPWRIL